MRLFLIPIGLFILAHFSANAQSCQFQIMPTSSAVCMGDTVCIGASGNVSGSTIQQFDFNTGTVPTGWSISGGGSFGQLCSSSPTGTDYYWSSTAGTITPIVETNPMDVSSGGIIQFDLVFGLQGGASPCEGPDNWDEGVSLQFSLDNGATWVDIVYFNPLGTFSTNPGGTVSGPTAFTSWGTYCFPIPPFAQTTATKFRWIQNVSSGTNFDNWGLDEISISDYLTGTSVNWSNGTTSTSSICIPIISDTTITAYLINSLGDTLSQDQTVINVLNPYSSSDTVMVCEGDDYTFADGSTETNIIVETTYTSAFQNINGCDSTITTTVIPISVQASATQTDSTITATNTGSGTTYQWLNCGNNFQVVSGETGQVFAPAQPGSYALVVIENGCSDTSSCFTITNLVNVKEFDWASISIYPNPTMHQFVIDLGSFRSNVNVRIVDAVGSIVLNKHFDKADVINIELEGNTGLYFVELSVSEHRSVYVLSKE